MSSSQETLVTQLNVLAEASMAQTLSRMPCSHEARQIRGDAVLRLVPGQRRASTLVRFPTLLVSTRAFVVPR